MANEGQSETHFNQQRTAIPFGKFESGAEDIFPCNESMVGREGARAKLIDFLTNAGTRKAILVTGRRGMGKTSFVQYCLGEYQEARVERYWHSNFGRSLYSFAWLFFISMLGASAYVIGSQILQILLENTYSGKDHFLWLIISLLAFFISYAFFYAGNLISEAIKLLPIIKHISNISALIFIILISYIFICTQAPSTGSPIIIFSGLVFCISLLYCIGELLYIKICLFKTLCLIFFIVIFVISTTQIKFEIPFRIEINSRDTTSFVLNMLLVALELFCFAAINRGWGLTRKNKKDRNSKTIRLALKKSVNWFYGFGFLILISILISSNSIYKGGEFYSILLLLLLIASFLISDICRDESQKSLDDESKKSRQAEFTRKCLLVLLLGMKAIFFILLGLYALHPLSPLLGNSKDINFCNWDASIKTMIEESNGIFLCNDKTSLVKFSDKNKGLFFIPKNRHYSDGINITYFKENSVNLEYIPLFFGAKDELAYIAIIAVIIAIFFWIEYEWIIRPGQFTKRDCSMFTGARPDYYGDYTSKPLNGLVWTDKDENEIQDNDKEKKYDKRRKQVQQKIQENIDAHAKNRESYRAIEKLTFLHYFNHFHLSSIVSTINLGFEELEHRSVIHSMLLSIREQYYNKFISLSSSRVLIRSIFGLCLAMILVTDLAESLFSRELVLCEGCEDNKNEKSKENKNLFKPKYKVNVSIPILINSDGEAEVRQNGQGQEMIVSEHKSPILTDKYCRRSENSSSQKETDDSSTLYNSLPLVPRLLCELGGSYANHILPILYFEIRPIKVESNIIEDGILGWIFDVHTHYYDNDQKQKWMSLSVYHLILFAFVFFAFRRLNRSFKLVPYPLILEKIDDLLDALTSTTTTKQNRTLPIVARWSSSLAGDYQHNEKNVARSNLDPRAVELQFMSVLEQICHARPVYFKPLQSGKRTPSVEITFVFDELDKLATDMNSQQKKGNPDCNDSELYRLNLMKGLLSNMKRIITSSEARYIFLGGRLLHDDWLADGARRQPLLTSIFSDEIYLPSLLTDSSISWYGCPSTSNQDTLPGNHSLHGRIEEYFVWQFFLSRKRFEHWSTHNWLPMIGLSNRDTRPLGFIQVSYKKLKESMGNELKESMKSVKEKRKESMKSDQNEQDQYDLDSPLHTIPIRNTNNNAAHLNRDNDRSREHSRLKAFVHFLAYRSVGNPKRLNELLGSFIISADRAVPDPNARGTGFNCQDVLYLPDHKVMRIQLIARVYQQLRKGFEEKIRGRDDKAIVSLIYLSDFLFKFHDRAFSWESLELIDELVHMHRGFDLRSLLFELVEHYSDRYLHRIINGLYAYRFRSYFANEVDYLSRHSEEEMAAFNFTLDEAQSLRDHFEKLLEIGDDRDKTDTLSKLGELHEFYQEYEMARQYYRRCINARYPMFKEHVGDKVGKGSKEMPVLRAVYTNNKEGRKALLSLMQWGPISLKLYLKIAMTYEKERSYNDALIRYERLIKFAESMIQAYIIIEPDNDVWSKPAQDYGKAYILEYLGLLFEPLFAHAWLLEKNAYTSGNSLHVLESGIKNIENILKIEPEPPLKTPDMLKYEAPLFFVQAQWYKKIGALCFYKGLAKTKDPTKTNATPYVDMARNEYSKSADKLSRYFKLHIKTDFNAVNANSFPDALVQNRYPTEFCLSVAECLGDLSESILAVLAPELVFSESGYPQNTSTDPTDDYFKGKAPKFIQQLDQYFFGCSENIEEEILDWFAEKNYNCKFEELNPQSKFDLALDLSFTSSFYLLRAGYVESAAREAMHTVEVIAQYLNWYLFDLSIESTNNEKITSVLPATEMAIDKVLGYTKYLPWLLTTVRFGVGRNTKDDKDEYLIGSLIPSSALTSLCSIGLSLSLLLSMGYSSDKKEKLEKSIESIKSTIDIWTASPAPAPETTEAATAADMYQLFEKKLIYSLQRHRYPVLNQLNALKILVDASLFRCLIKRSETNSECTKNTTAWLQELYHINEKYNYPLHFTPMELGFSLYLYCYAKEEHKISNSDKIKDFDLKAETRRFLIQSLDMCHMGRGYYQAIEKLYYLYDDFNDNQIHRNHALQMAGAGLAKKSLEKLRSKSLENGSLGI